MTTLKADTERVIATALAEVGTVESPPFSNKVRYSDWWGFRGPWCGMFASWVFWAAGHPLPSMQAGAKTGFAYCPSAVNWAKRNGVWTSKPERGSIVLFDFIGRPSHTGIVLGKMNDGRIHTVEGNTDAAGGRTGGRVMEHFRSTGQVVGYVKVTSTSKIVRPNPVQTGQRVMDMGTSGPDVRFTQACLNVVRCKFFPKLPRLVEDGQFGAKTRDAVKAFQRGKKLLADGKVGPVTLAALSFEVNAVTQAKR